MLRGLDERFDAVLTYRSAEGAEHVLRWTLDSEGEADSLALRVSEAAKNTGTVEELVALLGLEPCSWLRR